MSIVSTRNTVSNKNAKFDKLLAGNGEFFIFYIHILYLALFYNKFKYNFLYGEIIKSQSIIMKKKLSLFITLALATFMTTGCEELDNFLAMSETTPTTQKDDTESQNKKEEQEPTDKEDEKPQSIKVTSVTLYEYSTSLEIGEKYQILVTVLPEEADQTVSFETSDEKICDVSEQGLVTAISSGYASIRVTSEFDRTKTAKFNICVNEQESPPLPPGPENYTVSFNANGGTGSMTSQTTNGSTYVVPSCSFSYTNHTFNGWALNSASGTKYSVGSTIQNISSNITLFATWSENTTPATSYTVSFNANGGTGTMASQQTNGDSFVVPACGFSRENYNFKNWAYESKNGVEYSPGETIKNIQKNITLYALWTEQQTIDPENPDIPEGYYSQCEGLTGSSLQAKLKSINAPKNPSYDWSRYEDADEALDDSSSILCIYTRHNIPKSNHCEDYAWDKWNREHVWTQSAYPASKSDNHNIFACEGQINNYRGNLPYDEGGIVVTVFGHTTGCKMVSSVSFEPCDEAKGEIARAVMYGTVMYSYTMTQEIKSIELALKWHLEHPNTERDIRRNNVVYGNQGNRNPFVDHPEYACKIWGNTNSATKALCGGN